MGKRWFSHALTQALFDNGVFTVENWPEDLATPEETKEFWPYRITVLNYPLIGEKLPHLKVMLVFATYDHVQAAPDKPHIRQAYDGFKKRAGLWTRLNADLSYVRAEIHESASLQNGFPDNLANTEPQNWYKEAESWGFAGKLAGELTNRTVPLAGIAEMADRVRVGNWEDNLDSPLVESNFYQIFIQKYRDVLISYSKTITVKSAHTCALKSLCEGFQFSFSNMKISTKELHVLQVSNPSSELKKGSSSTII
jgi:hypothetical protein